MPWEFIGLQFYNQRKRWRGGKELLCLSWVDITFSSSAPPPGWAGEFSCPYMVKLSPQIIVFYVCRKHVPGIINLLSSLDRMWGSYCCCCSVVQPCLAFFDPIDCSPRGSSVHGILQARILEWVAISFSGSFWPREGTLTGKRILYHWATRETHTQGVYLRY